MLLSIPLVAFALSLAGPGVQAHGSHSLRPATRKTLAANFDAAYYVRGVSDVNVTTNATLSYGQTSPLLGRWKYYVDSKAGIICHILDTEGVDSVDRASLRETEDDGRKPIRVKFPSEQQKGSRNGVNYVTSSDCSKIDDLTRDLLAADKEDFELADLTSVADFFGEVKVSSPVATRLKGPLIKSELVVKEPKKFTSYWKSYANHTNVINGDGSPAPGPEGATAEVGFKINSKKDIICYDIKTFGVKGEWYNPGRTATHLGYPTGPSAYPRITFPNPTAVNSNEPDGEKVSKSCLKGPFATGRVEKGVDSGSESGFTLAGFEKDPTLYFFDLHTFDYDVGDVRGNFTKVEKF